MYSYHNRIRQRINNGELINHYFTDNYPRIGNALVLVFNTLPSVRPIRPHKWTDYADIVNKFKKEVIQCNS